MIKYTSPELEIFVVETNDIITGSTGTTEPSTPGSTVDPINPSLPDDEF
ncbi:MAG: hypothetical protein J6B29_05135 [Clostridia bacterium]|nr:hypothetical protein [Clostridia bacterium]